MRVRGRAADDLDAAAIVRRHESDVAVPRGRRPGRRIVADQGAALIVAFRQSSGHEFRGHNTHFLTDRRRCWRASETGGCSWSTASRRRSAATSPPAGRSARRRSSPGWMPASAVAFRRGDRGASRRRRPCPTRNRYCVPGITGGGPAGTPAAAGRMPDLVPRSSRGSPTAPRPLPRVGVSGASRCLSGLRRMTEPRARAYARGRRDINKGTLPFSRNKWLEWTPKL